MLKRDRIKTAMAHNPSELNLTRPWTAADEQSSGFTYLDGQRRVIMRCSAGNEELNHTHFKYVSPAQNKRSGHWPDMLEIQKYLLEPTWKENALAVQDHPNRYKKTRGSTYDLTFSTEPGNQPSGIHISNIAQQGTEAHRDCVRRIIKVMTEILEEHLADETSLEHRKIRWAVKASITAGDENNKWISHIQINVTDIDMGLGASLKKAGNPHFDQNDMPSMWTVLLFLSYYPEDYNPGILAIYSTRVCCPCVRYGACIMTGTHPHSGRGKGRLPLDYVRPSTRSGEMDLEYPDLPPHLVYSRLHAAGYPRNNNMQCHLPQISVELYKPFAIGAFGTPQNWVEFQLRTHIKTCIEVMIEDPQYWCDKFTYTDKNGINYKPRLWVAELCFRYADYAWLDTPEHNGLHKALVASGVGSKLPPNENAPSKPKPLRRKARALGAPLVKFTCDGLTSKGERCKKTFQPKPDSNTRCGFHQKTEVSTEGDASNIRQEPANDPESHPNELKRTLDEMESLQLVADMDTDDEFWDEREEKEGEFDSNFSLQEFYNGVESSGGADPYGSVSPKYYAEPENDEQEDGDEAGYHLQNMHSGQIDPQYVGNMDVSGIYDDE
jgi:hypothetical protein